MVWNTVCCRGKRIKQLQVNLSVNNAAFLPHDARSAKRVAIVSRPSVCLSVTLMYRKHIGWTSLKLIMRIISLGSSLLEATTLAI